MHNKIKQQEQRRTRALVLVLAAMWLPVFILAVPACNTTEGVGKDVKELGEGIEDAADDAND